MVRDKVTRQGKEDMNARGIHKWKEGLGIPEEIDPFHKNNLPRKGEPSTILKFLRLLSLWILAFSLISSFIYSILLAADVFSDPRLLEAREITSYCLSLVTLSGFLMLGIASETKFRGTDIQEILEKKRLKMEELGLTKEQARLVEEEFMPASVLDKRRGSKFKKFFLAMAIGCLGTYAFFYFVFHSTYHVLAMYGIVGAIISIGFILSGLAGEINVELWRFEIFGLHVHEAAVGIFFIIVAIPLMYNGATIDKILAAFYFFVGAYLMGRDWKDVSMGKIIVRTRDENEMTGN